IAEGVENAEVVCCFITPDYQDSWHCQMELQYACERCKPIIPCILSDTRIWEPSNWLNLITRELVYVDFHNISESTIHSKTRELIDRIKEQLCTLQYLSSKPVNEPSYLFELIKHEYTRNTRIERLMNSARSYPIEEVYINLSIVETEEQQGKSKKPRHIQHSNTNVDIFEDIYGFKTSVDVKDLFTVCADETKKVLVLGRAGIGKSTFCRHVSYRWAKGEIWSQYDLVILIPLRYLTDNRYPRLSSGNSYSIIDIVKKEYFSHLHLSEIDERLLREQLDKSSVLWLLDGYDEIEKNIPTHLKDLLEQLLNTTHHILTSRSNLHTLSYTVQMEITGFTDASINHYVKIFFNQIQDRLDNALSAAQKLINFLKLNPIIWNIAHIPINLELICSLWSDTDWSETKTLTITALYDKIIEWLCRRYLTRQNGTTQMMKREVYARCYKELAFLETLAFVGMENDTILLSEELLNKVMEETGLSLTNHPHLLNIGILKSFNHQPISRQSELEKSHYFVHISFQEHFAARYLVNALKNSARQKAIDFIKYHKYNQRFQMVLTFISGLLSKMKDESCTDTFWDTISEEPLDLVGLRHIQLVISWIEETGNNSHFYRRTELMDAIIKWITLALSTHDDVRACKAVATIGAKAASTDVVDWLMAALEDKDCQVRRSACEAIRAVGEKITTRDVINKLVEVLEHENPEVRRSACEAIGAIGQKVVTSDVINRLLNILENDSSEVRQSACKAIGTMGVQLVTMDVIDRLLITLKDENPEVRQSACETLGIICDKTATDVIFNGLVAALENENEDITSNAYQTLGKIGEKAAINGVITALVTALGDPGPEVRSTAWDALIKIGDKTDTHDLINQLATALGSQNVEVKRSVCEILGLLGDKAATRDVIDRLVTALADADGQVKSSACRALGKMEKESANKEVIKSLLAALVDNDPRVRSSACQALGKVGEKAATDDVINGLMNALTDKNGGVKLSACEAFGKLVGKVTTGNMIDMLVAALNDQLNVHNSEVKRSACDALGKIGEKAASDDVINELITVLVDENPEARQSAFMALGKMGKKAVTDKVIRKLVAVLPYENPGIRWSEDDIGKRIGEKDGTKDVTNEPTTDLWFDKITETDEIIDALGRVLPSFSAVTQLHSDTVGKLYYCINRLSCGGYINVGIVLLGTKSLLTARDIARKAANNGLISVLFEIGIVDDIHLLNIDSNRVVFRLGATFHVESVNLAPDGIRYVRMKYSDSQYQIIKKQIRFETGVKLSWLTLGNYLYFLNQFEQAISYYNYLLDKLPQEHTDRSSIYNNMGLICALSGKKDDAEKLYDKALKRAKPVSSVWISDESDDESYSQVPAAGITIIEMTTHRSTIFGTIGDSYYKTNRFKLALDYYKKALESCNEPQCRSYYQRMIRTIIKET
ncbi:unnamed protein product, partial [Rotaria sp. Silwood2]